jgi:hypothetical protein
MATLSSWSESSNHVVRYFSGTATYRKRITAPRSWFCPGTALTLDLGNVANLAEVTINGKPLGILWKAPYRVDLAGAPVNDQGCTKKSPRPGGSNL